MLGDSAEIVEQTRIVSEVELEIVEDSENIVSTEYTRRDAAAAAVPYILVPCWWTMFLIMFLLLFFCYCDCEIVCKYYILFKIL